MSYLDEFIVGAPLTLGSHRFEADEIKRFAAKYDPQAFHVDEAAAERSLLGALCASGWHTAAICMRLNVENRQAAARRWIEAGNPPPRLGPSPGASNLRWTKPVFVGDTITYTQTVTGKRPSASRPGWGIVEFSTEAVNQRGEKVFSFDGAAFFGID